MYRNSTEVVHFVISNFWHDICKFKNLVSSSCKILFNRIHLGYELHHHVWVGNRNSINNQQDSINLSCHKSMSPCLFTTLKKENTIIIIQKAFYILSSIYYVTIHYHPFCLILCLKGHWARLPGSCFLWHIYCTFILLS